MKNHGLSAIALSLGLVAGAHAGLPDCALMGLQACPQPFDAVLPSAADLLTWDTASRVIGFRNTYRLYSGDVFRTLGRTPFPLPQAITPMPAPHYRMDGKQLGLKDYLRRQRVTGLLILKDGRIAYEYYGHGNTETTLWTSRSVAKSVVSVLVGMAIQEKFIGSVDDPVVRYLPELKDSAWQDVTLRHLLSHTSGMVWNENYADPASDFAHLTRCEAGPAAYPCVMQLVAAMKRKPGVKPGEVWSYNTGGAWLVGRVLEKATGMTIAHYLESRLWSRFAMEADGMWESLLKDQVDMGGHGFNATLRDWARFGLFVSRGGTLRNGASVLPADWIEQSVTWTRAQGSVTPSAPDGQYGFQWWFGGLDPNRTGTDNAIQTARQTFWAEGIYGQSIAINRRENLVVVQWATWENAESPDSLYEEQVLFFNALARALTRHPGETPP